MASSIVLKRLLASNLLSRVAVPLRPAVASGVPVRGFSTSYYESVSLTTKVSKPPSFKKEDAENIYLYVDMPGIDKDDVEATVQPLYYNENICSLKINGEALKKDYECECRLYHDSFDIPENVKATEIKAGMEKGVLKLTLPKTKEKINKDQKMIHKITIKIDSKH